MHCLLLSFHKPRSRQYSRHEQQSQDFLVFYQSTNLNLAGSRSFAPSKGRDLLIAYEPAWLHRFLFLLPPSSFIHEVCHDILSTSPAWWRSLHLLAHVDLYKEGLDLFSNSQAIALLYKACFGSSEEKLVLMQSPGLLIFLTSRYSLILSNEIQARHRGASVTAMFPLCSESTRLQPQCQFLSLLSSLEWAALGVLLRSHWWLPIAMKFRRRSDSNPDVCQHLHPLSIFRSQLNSDARSSRNIRALLLAQEPSALITKSTFTTSRP